MDELEQIKSKKLKSMAEKMNIGGNNVSEVVKVNGGNFQEFLQNNKNVVVDFWAEWCGPCRLVSPVVEELAKEYNSVAFGKLNTDENQSIAASFGITAIPTLIFFKDGKPTDQIVGAFPKSELKRWVDKNLD